MADEKRVTVKQPEVKEGIFDITEGVEVTTTATAPHHKAGEKLTVSQFLADKMIANGWAEKGGK